VLRFAGADQNDGSVSIDHTANGWLQVEFAGGGSVTFAGNEAMASIQTMAALNTYANVVYDDTF
jgi:hypothetical protein